MQARSEYQTILSGKPIIAVFMGIAVFILGVWAGPLGCRIALALQDAQVAEMESIDIEQANKVYQAALQAMETGDWKLAANQLNQFVQLVPNEFSSRVLLAQCLTQLEDSQAALDQLTAAVEVGWEDEEKLNGSPEFAALRKDRRYDEIRLVMRRYKQAKFFVLLPQDHQTVDATTQMPVVLYFHGRGESARSSIPLWQPIADQLGVCIVLPKGTRPLRQVYTWDAADAKGNEPWKLDRDAARAAAAAALNGLEEEHGITPSTLCFAGFSQGAVVAMELAAAPADDSPIAADAVLLMSGAFSPEPKFELPAGMKIAQFVGRQESWLDANHTLRDSLERQQIKLRYHELDAGHDLPRPFSKTIGSLLREFLLALPDAKDNRH